MNMLLLLALVVTTTKAALPLYSSPHHVHADSGRGGHGPNHVNHQLPASLLEMCDGIVNHGHSSGPQAVGHKVFRVGAGIVCVDQAPAASVITDTTATDAPATDAPATEDAATDAPATEDPATDVPVTDAAAREDSSTDDPATDALVTDATDVTSATDAAARDDSSTGATDTDAPATDSPAEA